MFHTALVELSGFNKRKFIQSVSEKGGVPQGSELINILNLLYISHKPLQKNAKVTIFAGYRVMLVEGVPIKEATDTLQKLQKTL